MKRARSLHGMRIGVLAWTALLLLGLPGTTVSRALAELSRKNPAKVITDGIICPCSCGEILTGCTCDTGKAMRAYVDAEVKGGKSKDQIEAALVNQYGEVILGAPKAQGFNLLVWIAPAVATMVGILIASFVLVRWRRRGLEMASAAGGGIGAGPGASPAGGSAASGGSGASGRGPGAPFGGDAEAHAEALRARAEEELRRLRE